MAERAGSFLRVVSGPGDDAPLLTDEAARLFPDTLSARWLRACRKLSGAGYGEMVVSAYARHSMQCAELVGPEAAIEMANTVSAVAIKAGRPAAAMLPAAAARAAEILDDELRFRSWLSLMQRSAALAPESAEAIIGRTETLLGHLNVSRLESWILAGVRSAGGDAQRRLRFFRMEDPYCYRWL
jgi:hypothetical protein